MKDDRDLKPLIDQVQKAQDKPFITPAPTEEVKLPKIRQESNKSPDPIFCTSQIQESLPNTEKKQNSGIKDKEKENKDCLPAINSFETPLVTMTEKRKAMDYGYSFGSKRMAMAPTFFNLRLICDCLGRAMRRHMDYSYGVFWFLEDLARAKKILKKQKNGEDVDPLAESGASHVTAFSYNFKDDLKLNQ